MGRSLSVSTAKDFAALLDVYDTALALAEKARLDGAKSDALRKVLAKAQMIEDRVLAYKPITPAEMQQKLDFLLSFLATAVDERDLIVTNAISQIRVDFDLLWRTLPADATSSTRKLRRGGTKAKPAP